MVFAEKERGNLKQKGFSLPELMVCLALGIMLLTVCAQSMIHSVRLNRIAHQQMEMQYSAQVVRNILSRDIQNAGHYLWFLKQHTIAGTAKAEVFKQECKGGDESFAHALSPKVFGLNTTKGNFACLEKYIPGSDVLILKLLQNVMHFEWVWGNPNKQWQQCPLSTRLELVALLLCHSDGSL